MSAPLADIQTKGLLDKTLVVLGTEFGRTPRINDNDGWDHHDEGFTCLLAGAGIDGGEVATTPTATTSKGTRFKLWTSPRGCRSRHWWSWAPSSAARLGSTVTTGERLRSDNFEGTSG